MINEFNKVWYKVVFPFAPHRKQSVRVFRSRYGGAPIVSDPDRDLKNELARWASENTVLPPHPTDQAIYAEFIYNFEPPKSWAQKKKAKYLITRTGEEITLDVDNMQKLYQDVLQFGDLSGKIFLDDKQIFSSTSTKLWSEKACVEITLYIRD